MKLNELKVDTPAVICNIALEEKDKKRLFFIGLYKGANIIKLQVAPLGDPVLYFVLGNQIILRNADAQRIEVEVKE